MEILIVAKKAAFIQDLKQALDSLAHSVLFADTEEKALRLLEGHKELRMVFVDSSLDENRCVRFCQKAKAASSKRYIYVIMVCDHHERAEASRCLDLGGDDCLSRPIAGGTLQVRLNAGTKIIHLNEKLRDANEVMQIDLLSGREAQESMIPVSFPDIPNMEIAARFIPSAFVSGDIYNIFRLDEQHVGLYSIDVSGHGVAAALFSVGLSQKLNSNLQPSGLLKKPISTPPFYHINAPDKVVSALDEDDMLGKYGRYFTMVYAVVHLKEKSLSFCRAGHNLPLLIHAEGTSRYLEGGSAPLGLGLGSSDKSLQTLRLNEGDAFILFSDGINEAFSSRRKNGYGLMRVKDMLTAYRGKSLHEAFDLLLGDVKDFHGGSEFNDDISIIGFRWRDS